MAGLIGIGSGLLDLLAYVPESFLDRVPGRKGGMELVDHPELRRILEALPRPPERRPGGSAANTVVAAARLGLHAGFVTMIGSDPEGDAYRDGMAAAGVDTRSFKRTGEATPTGCCLSLITPDSQRTMRTFLGASAELRPVHIGEEDFAGYDLAHLEGYLLFNPDLMMHVLDRARRAGCRISLDLSAPEVVAGARELLPDLLDEFVDVVFANEDEGAEFCGSKHEDEALNALARHCEIAALKLGARGALIRRGPNETVEARALPVEAVDSTGAGDYWAAGFLYGLLSGWDLGRAAALGARLGAEVVQVTGAHLPDQTWDALACSLPGVRRERA
ncbi:MAG: adenosine kinase [Kiritimatiellaeota bacterium]|nr:adenosine kinase [Kiritimatiellota bacterium]